VLQVRLSLLRRHPSLIAILLLALVLRLQLATSEPYIHDEDNNSIPLSKTISFDPDHLHLPIRGENHLALPAYVVKASSSLFGATRLGYRMVHVLMGLCTIVLIFVVTRQWYGAAAAGWAAALLAFNEYYLAISARATAHAPQLFFLALAMYAFSRFLAGSSARYLYGAFAAVGAAFYCKEHSALLLPIFLLTLLAQRNRQWYRGPHPYLACALFALLIGPDLVWNLKTGSEESLVNYSNQVARQATYRTHLQRIGGLGFSPYPSMFYARGVVMAAHRLATGRELKDETPEYPSMNPVLGGLLVATVLIAIARPSGADRIRPFLLLWFLGVFGFYTLIRPGNPPGRLDPVSWIWVDGTMLPAVALAGAWLSTGPWRWRLIGWVVGGAALLYAVQAVVPR
jgi:hypothetical protein